MIRPHLSTEKHRDSRIQYRGATPSRLDNLTDAVFGIAITLLIFNLNNPNSFEDLITFTKTLPAFLISIGFIVLVWKEHVRFSQVFSLNDTRLEFLNTLFIALIIFYVYPLRFLTLFITNFFFRTNIEIQIRYSQIPDLMIYYGFIAFALYFILFLLYRRAKKIADELQLSEFERFFVKAQSVRLGLMFSVPLLSVFITLVFSKIAPVWSSFYSGMVYNLYWPTLVLYQRWYNRKQKEFPTSGNEKAEWQ